MFDALAFRRRAYADKKVVVMGYGLYPQGSGYAATAYLAQTGAKIIVTDLRDESTLAQNRARLEHYDNIEWKLGRHDMQDFIEADIVVKNPGVHHTSPYLKQAKRIESDISLFLYEYRAMLQANGYQHQLVAVSGSKGKSSTVTLIHHFAQALGRYALLAGNITTSPLFYLDELTTQTQALLILELSSWQLADVANKGLLQPDVALLTNLMEDHLNYYQGDMAAYAKDKAQLFAEQEVQQWSVFDLDDRHTPFFIQSAVSKQQAFYSRSLLPTLYPHGAYWQDDQHLVMRLAGKDHILHINNLPLGLLAENLAKALLVVQCLGFSIEQARDHLLGYQGPRYRCQLVASCADFRFFNDSAATIPQATVMAIKSLRTPQRRIALILGGASKGNDLDVLKEVLPQVGWVYLLSGTAQDSFEALLNSEQVSYSKGHTQFDDIIKDFARRFAGQLADLVLSPGVASFGLFLNEFDRGDAFNAAVLSYLARKDN